MSIYVMAPELPVVIEFTDGPEHLKDAAIAIETAIRDGFVFDIQIQNDETGEIANRLVVNFAGFGTFNVRSSDPRDDEDGAGDHIFYRVPIVDFLRAVLTDHAERTATE